MSEGSISISQGRGSVSLSGEGGSVSRNAVHRAALSNERLFEAINSREAREREELYRLLVQEAMKFNLNPFAWNARQVNPTANPEPVRPQPEEQLVVNVMPHTIQYAGHTVEVWVVTQDRRNEPRNRGLRWDCLFGTLKQPHPDQMTVAFQCAVDQYANLPFQAMFEAPLRVAKALKINVDIQQEAVRRGRFEGYTLNVLSQSANSGHNTYGAAIRVGFTATDEQTGKQKVVLSLVNLYSAWVEPGHVPLLVQHLKEAEPHYNLEAQCQVLKTVRLPVAKTLTPPTEDQVQAWIQSISVHGGAYRPSTLGSPSLQRPQGKRPRSGAP